MTTALLAERVDQAARQPQVTASTLADYRRRGERFAVLTCYDASFATLLSEAGVEALLVGDSLGMVCQGHDSTLPVGLADIEYHTLCVARGNRGALLIADLPAGTYGSPAQTYQAASRLLRVGAHMVKLEGGAWLAPSVRFLVERGIPVCGHLGLMPQSVHLLGGYKVQGRTSEGAAAIQADALALQEAGASSILLEAIPASLGRELTAALRIPTIGIGAGPDCSGQVLVLHDMLDIYPGPKPRFVKNFMAGQSSVRAAVAAYVAAVKAGEFPGVEHGF